MAALSIINTWGMPLRSGLVVQNMIHPVVRFANKNESFSREQLLEICKLIIQLERNVQSSTQCGLVLAEVTLPD